MELFNAIFNRRSIRKYVNKKVEDDLVETILKAGMYAPSAVNKQPWHFIVFRDKASCSKIMEVHPSSTMLKECDVAILVCFDENLQHDDGYGIVDCAAATQNMLLAAHGLGLGAVWVGIFPREKRMEACTDIFGLPEHVKAFAVISIGYPGEEKQKPERFNGQRIRYEKW